MLDAMAARGSVKLLRHVDYQRVVRITHICKRRRGDHPDLVSPKFFSVPEMSDTSVTRCGPSSALQPVCKTAETTARADQIATATMSVRS